MLRDPRPGRARGLAAAARGADRAQDRLAPRSGPSFAALGWARARTPAPCSSARRLRVAECAVPRTAACVRAFSSRIQSERATGAHTSPQRPRPERSNRRRSVAPSRAREVVRLRRSAPRVRVVQRARRPGIWPLAQAISSSAFRRTGFRRPMRTRRPRARWRAREPAPQRQYAPHTVAAGGVLDGSPAN